jgi:hypothetical protein
MPVILLSDFAQVVRFKIKVKELQHQQTYKQIPCHKIVLSIESSS